MSTTTQFQGSSDVSLSPGQAKFLYWFVGTAPILKAMTPITTYQGMMKKKLQDLKQAGKPLTEKVYTDVYRSVLSDFSRQTITCSFQLMSYFVVGDAIKAILKKIYSKKPVEQQDPGFQQVLMQAIPLTVQVVATILSRNYGAADLQAIFDVNQVTGKSERPANGKVGFFREKAMNFIDTHLRSTEAGKMGQLLPRKAAMVATAGMMGYFAALVGILYGISSGLEKAFPGTFKSRPGKDKPEASGTPAQPAPQPAANLDVTSPSPMNTPSTASPWAHVQRPTLATFGAHRPMAPMGFSS